MNRDNWHAWKDHWGYLHILTNPDRAKEVFENNCKDEINRHVFEDALEEVWNIPVAERKLWQDDQAKEALRLISLLETAEETGTNEDYLNLIVAYGKSDYSDEGFRYWDMREITFYD